MYEKREEEHTWMNDLYAHWNISNAEIDEFLARRYIERIIGCVENITNKNCTLTAKEKKAEIKKMICTDTAQTAVRTAVPKSSYMKILLLPIKWKNVSLLYMMSCYISKVKSSNTKLFAKLKAGR